MSSWRGTGYSREKTTTTTTTTTGGETGRGAEPSLVAVQQEPVRGFGRPSRRVLASGAGRDGPRRTRGVADWRRPERRRRVRSGESDRGRERRAIDESELAGKVAAAARARSSRASSSFSSSVDRTPEGRFEQRRVRDWGATPTSFRRIEIEDEDDDEGNDRDGERVESRNTRESSRAPTSPTTAAAEAIVGRSRVPLTSRAAKFMATLGAARRGTAEDRADIRRRLGLPEVDEGHEGHEGTRRSFAEEDDDEGALEEEREEADPYATRSPDRKPRSLAGSWLSDSAAAAAAAAAAGAQPRSPRMPSIREEPTSSTSPIIAPIIARFARRR